ncbi:MAG: hypothetical protein A2463_04955 [Candidatus Staskawiczbacteria bacterium RIFOXYC2_FULL_32_10]|nr:MAG: hypothetical protein A2463_04955 [Candidatus Staskawiczbacteria bacterium RIFOXYC2_FULL_32_10]
MIRGDTPTRREVEAKIQGVGDYVKMDYLQSTLKKNIDFDTRKFVMMTLAGIYEQRGMFNDAAKLVNGSAEINTTFQGKVMDYSRAMALFIKAGSYDESDVAFSKALACCNTTQKNNLRMKRKVMFFEQAKFYVTKDKRTNAMKTYEKIMALDLSPQEREAAQATLTELYEKLGRIREFYAMKRGQAFTNQPKPQELQEREETRFDIDDLLR